MVGKKFFMALVKEFQELCQILSCQNGQSSPTHSTYDNSRANQRNLHISTHSLSPIKEEAEDFLNDEMGNKPPKLLDCDTSAYQEHVLKILREENAPLKDSNFSPYTPLPAIGKSTFDSEHAERKIERQLTYRVLNPVYVKGPMDMYKFPPLNGNIILEDGILKRNNFQKTNQLPRKKSLKTVTHIVEEPKINLTKSPFGPKRTTELNGTIPYNTEKLKQSDTNKENTSAFWIEF